jgi:hypothetical protein
MSRIIRLPRKLKNKIIKCFGRKTYQGIMEKCIAIDTYHKGKGVVTIALDKNRKLEGSMYYHTHQYNPYLMCKKIK